MQEKILKTDLFPNPLFIVNNLLEDNQRLNLVDECYRWKESSKTVISSNFGGWHSEQTLFKRNEEPFKLLCQSIFTRIVAINQNIDKSWDPAKHTKTRCEGWVNINKSIDINSPHDHGGYTWSGCYYVKIPTKSSSLEKSGAIEFIDPRSGISGIKLFKAHQKTSYVPSENQLFVWPSWVKHFVYPHLESDDRISIAFNIDFP
jgi:uncharacterized protein (TIGR02466 family)